MMSGGQLLQLLLGLSLQPETGACLVFRQPPGACLLHDGEEVRAGIKYLLRTDVMYRRAGGVF
jgi:hypothetical protein